MVAREQLLAELEAILAEDDVVAKRRLLHSLQRRLHLLETPVEETTPSNDADAPERKYVLERLTQVAHARTVERADYYLRRLITGLQHSRTNGINDINLNRWQEYEDIRTDSLWIEPRRDNTGVHNAGYWGNFIPQIPHQLMLRFTRRGDWVLDAFAGMGTTLIEGRRLGRNVLGVELQADVAGRALDLLGAEPNPFDVTTALEVGDSTQADFAALLAGLGPQSVQLVILHPPYHDIIRFSSDPRDLSNAADLEEFLLRMQLVVDNARQVLQQGRFLALVIGDKYAGGQWIPLGFLAMNRILERGFVLKSLIVKNFEDTTAKRRQRELWRYRALVGGFYIFKHEYVFLFRKI